MISPRFAVAVSLLLAIALAPTLIHSFVGARTNDGRLTMAIDTTLAGLTSAPTERRAEWVRETYDSVDWIERRYTGPDGSDIVLFVARSYDLKRLYHHPELGVARGHDLGRAVTISLPDLNGAPVHVLKAQNGGMAAYSLVYDDEFVGDPIALQLRTAWELLFSARQPMTLFFVFDGQLAADAPFEKSKAARVLVDAVTSFRKQTVSSVPRPPQGGAS